MLPVDDAWTHARVEYTVSCTVSPVRQTPIQVSYPVCTHLQSLVKSANESRTTLSRANTSVSDSVIWWCLQLTSQLTASSSVHSSLSCTQLWYILRLTTLSASDLIEANTTIEQCDEEEFDAVALQLIFSDLNMSNIFKTVFMQFN